MTSRKIKVLIDLDSIERNPNAGATSTNIPGRGTTEEVWRIGRTRITLIDGHFSNAQSPVNDGVFPGDTPVLISRTVDRPVITIGHQPEPEYSFSYLPKKIQCRSCGKTSCITDLLSDIYFRGDDECVSSERICPHCDTWNCISGEIEWESIEDALRRKELRDGNRN